MAKLKHSAPEEPKVEANDSVLPLREVSGAGDGPLPLQKDKLYNVPNEFNGTIYTIVPRPNQGFANFAIADVEIKDGVVQKITLSEPYAFFEAIARLEIRNEKMLTEMNRKYPVPGLRYV